MGAGQADFGGSLDFAVGEQSGLLFDVRHARSSPGAAFRARHIRLDLPTAEPIRSLERSVLIRGDAERALDLLPANSVQTVVTSPPYWSLRDYESPDQIGLDETLEDYLASLVRTFRR